MSRIAKDPVNIPESVNITTEGQTINFKGPKGEMTLEVHESVSFTHEENSLHVKWKNEEDSKHQTKKKGKTKKKTKNPKIYT